MVFLFEGVRLQYRVLNKNRAAAESERADQLVDGTFHHVAVVGKCVLVVSLCVIVCVCVCVPVCVFDMRAR